MGREGRPTANNTVYHVVARGNNRDALFLTDIDRETYLRLWRKYSRELEFDIYAYVLMTNHVHWLIRTGRVSISTIIHSVHGAYARIFNQAHDRVGHVFQGRFKSYVCMEDKYVLSLCRYIHRNPLEAGLVENLLEYPWSSYPDLCGCRSDSLVRPGIWLDYFSHPVSKKMRQWVEGQVEDQEVEMEIKTDAMICGVAPAGENRLGLDELASMMAVRFHVNIEELRGESRTQYCVLARKVFIKEAVQRHAYKRAEVARYLKKDRSLVTKVLQGQL